MERLAITNARLARKRHLRNSAYPVKIFHHQFFFIQNRIVRTARHNQSVSRNVFLRNINRFRLSAQSKTVPLADCVEMRAFVFSKRSPVGRKNLSRLLWQNPAQKFLKINFADKTKPL